jgi:multidrug efflux pump
MIKKQGEEMTQIPKKNLVMISIENRKIVFFIVILIIIAGIYNYYFLPKQEDPDITVPVAVITVVYPGASPENVEKLITRKIEDEVVSLPGFDTVSSHSRNSAAIIVVWLEQEADTEIAWRKLRDRMQDIKPELPGEVENIEIDTNLDETAGVILGISGETHTYEELEYYAEIIENDLRSIDGISRIALSGIQNKEIVVAADIEKLRFYDISLNDIVNIIKSQNIEIPSGEIKKDDYRISINTKGTYTSLEDIGNTVVYISMDSGGAVTLKDIASISYRLEEGNEKVTVNSKEAILVSSYFKKDKNIILIGKDVNSIIENSRKSIPDTVKIEKILFQPEDVKKSINTFGINLIYGIIFVIIVVLTGMGIRNAVIISVAIPVSIFITLNTMNIVDLKFHQISIAGFIVALGMLVDNAIVISDSIQVKLDTGMNRMESCTEGVREVAVPVLTSTLTTIGAFLPLLVLPGVAGEYVKGIPLVVIIALLASYILAIFLTPVMAYLFFRKRKISKKRAKIRVFFALLLRQAMRKKAITILSLFTITAISVYLATNLGLQFFPKTDKNIVYINIKTERSSNINTTKAFTDIIEGILKEQKEITEYATNIGNGLPKFYTTVPVPVKNESTAQMRLILDLKKGGRFSNNSDFVSYLQHELNSRLTGGTAIIKELELAEPIGSPVRIILKSDSLDKLYTAKEKAKRILRDIKGAINVDDDFSNKIYEYSVIVDIEKAAFFGITNYDVQNEVSIALKGRETDIFRDKGKEYTIIVKGNINEVKQIENMAIKSSYTGNKIILKEIAQIRLESSIPSIEKEDRELAVTVSSDVKPGFSAVFVQDAFKEKLEKEIFDGVTYTFDGEKEKIMKHFSNIGTSAIIAIFLIYGILLIQFRSYRQPLIILVTVPLSAIGSIIGLYITGLPLSFMSLLGIVSLVGIVVNNAIVLIDYINLKRKEGMRVKHACIEASDKRFRPIILSTVTTVIGLIPLALSKSPLTVPMAIALMSGLIVSTLLTLIIIPTVYYYFNKN